MTTFEPSVALTTCENALRELMRSAYSGTWGSVWIEKVATEKQRARWDEHRAAERALDRKGVTALSGRELEYSYFYDLVDIADRHWEPLSSALGKKGKTLPLIKRFGELRDMIAHGRTLLRFEEELLSGIAGQIRNQVTIYMSSQDQLGDYYPRIDSIIDSFGNEIVPASRHSKDSEIAGSCKTDLTLRPGQTVSFRCRGTDPQQRDLTWRLPGQPMGTTADEVTVASGDEAILSLLVTGQHVRAQATVEIYLTSTGQFHRCGRFDQRAFFRYEVVPPDM